MNKIIYITNTKLGTSKAHGYQILAMAKAFAQAGTQLELWVPRRGSPTLGVAPFAVRRLFVLNLFPFERFLGFIPVFVQAVTFYCSAAFRALFASRQSIIYTRDYVVALFALLGYRLIYECHSIPQRPLVFFLMMRLVHRVVVISGPLRDAFIVRGIPAHRLLLAPDAVDLSIFDLGLNPEQARVALRASTVPDGGSALIYCTGITYPSPHANRMQTIAMARAFAAQLGNNFYLGGVGIQLDGVNVVTFPKSHVSILAWRYLQFIRDHHIVRVYAREARLLFCIMLYNVLFFRLSLRYIYEVHALLARNIVDRWVDRYLTARVHHLLFLTTALRDAFVSVYRPGSQSLVVSGDAVDLSIFDSSVLASNARAMLNLPLNVPLLGYTGHFRTLGMDKGIHDILLALRELPAHVRFVAIGGSDADIAHYAAEARAAGVADRVMLLPRVSQTELAVYQRACDILLMPFPNRTHFAQYMSPLKLFEYMAAERPIVATDLPSLRDVLSEANSVLVPPGDPHALALGIKRLLDDHALGARLAAQAYQDVKKYTWDERVRGILGLLG